MSSNHAIKIRLRKDQLEQIRKDSKEKGFRYMTDYARWVILEKSTATEEKINTIYNILKKNDEERKQ